MKKSAPVIPRQVCLTLGTVAAPTFHSNPLLLAHKVEPLLSVIRYIVTSAHYAAGKDARDALPMPEMKPATLHTQEFHRSTYSNPPPSRSHRKIRNTRSETSQLQKPEKKTKAEINKSLDKLKSVTAGCIGIAF